MSPYKDNELAATFKCQVLEQQLRNKDREIRELRQRILRNSWWNRFKRVLNTPVSRLVWGPPPREKPDGSQSVGPRRLLAINLRNGEVLFDPPKISIIFGHERK